MCEKCDFRVVDGRSSLCRNRRAERSFRLDLVGFDVVESTGETISNVVFRNSGKAPSSSLPVRLDVGIYSSRTEEGAGTAGSGCRKGRVSRLEKRRGMKDEDPTHACAQHQCRFPFFVLGTNPRSNSDTYVHTERERRTERETVVPSAPLCRQSFIPSDTCVDTL